MNRDTPEIKITYDYCSNEFEAVGENIEADLSAVRITLVRDIHFNDFDLTVCVYGQGGTEEAPVVEKILSIPEAGLDRDQLRAGHPVDPRTVLNLFDTPFRTLLENKGIRIEWNPDHPGAIAIDLENIEGTPPLRQEFRR